MGYKAEIFNLVVERGEIDNSPDLISLQSSLGRE